MPKHLVLLFLLLLPIIVQGQETNMLDKITLQTGEVYVGKIILNTHDVVMITTANGMRYQFATTEIKTIVVANKVVDNATDSIANSHSDDVKPSYFAIITDVNAGLALSKNTFSPSPTLMASMVLGKRFSTNRLSYIGVGLGYQSVIVPSKNAISFLPLFVRLQRTLNNNHTAPFLGMDAGYVVALSEGDKGGETVRFFGGISHKISYNSAVSVALFAGFQAYNGLLVEKNEYGTFSYVGSTSIITVGCKVGLQF